MLDKAKSDALVYSSLGESRILRLFEQDCLRSLHVHDVLKNFLLFYGKV